MLIFMTQKTSDLTEQTKHNGEKFYAFHNARLYDKNESQVASLEEPLFISVNITELSEDEFAVKEKEIKEKYGFCEYVKKEEDGKMYAVFQMFSGEYEALDFLRKYTASLGGKWEETFGIFEQITEEKALKVETAVGIVEMKGKFVDNYYLKRTKGQS